MTLRLCSAMAIWLMPFCLFAQDPELAKLQETYPKEDVVVLKDLTEVTFELVDGEVQMLVETYVEKQYLNNEAISYSGRSINYNSFSEIDDLKPYTLVPKGNGRYKKRKVRDFTKKDEFTSGIFHDDVVSLNFQFPDMTEGCKTVLQYQKRYKEAHLLSGEYFIYVYPTLSHQVRYIIPHEIEVKLNKFHFQEYVNQKETDDGKNRIVEFSVEQPEKIKMEPGWPSISYFAPHVIPQVVSYTHKGTKHFVLRNTDDLFGWYNSLIEDFNQEESEALKGIVDSLVQDLDTDYDKTKAIFYWVQSKIKYVAFEDGLGGFIPRPASKVCDRRYGDCKDMASIITKMMEYADVEGHVTWIGSRDLPYTYNELPTPNVDNHMIAAFKHEGEYIFLDATNEYIPMGRPSGFTQGKEAMIKTGDDSYEIVEVPIMPAATNAREQEVELYLEGDMLKGQGVLQLKGYLKDDHRRWFENMDHSEKKEALDRYLELGNNKFALEDFEAKNLTEKAKPTTIDYTFTMPGYARFNKDEIYINMSMDEVFERDKLEKDRKFPLGMRYLASYTSTYTLSIPEGYGANYLPEDVNYSTDHFTYTCSYKVKEGKLVFTQHLSIHTMLVDAALFEEWNTFIDTAKKSQNESIILKKQ